MSPINIHPGLASRPYASRLGKQDDSDGVFRGSTLWHPYSGCPKSQNPGNPGHGHTVSAAASAAVSAAVTVLRTKHKLTASERTLRSLDHGKVLDLKNSLEVKRDS